MSGLPDCCACRSRIRRRLCERLGQDERQFTEHGGLDRPFFEPRHLGGRAGKQQRFAQQRRHINSGGMLGIIEQRHVDLALAQTIREWSR